MHKLNTNLAAVSISIRINELSETPLLLSLNNSAAKGHFDGKFSVHISFGKPIARWIEQAKKFIVWEAELFG